MTLGMQINFSTWGYYVASSTIYFKMFIKNYGLIGKTIVVL